MVSCSDIPVELFHVVSLNHQELHHALLGTLLLCPAASSGRHHAADSEHCLGTHAGTWDNRGSATSQIKI